MRSRLSPRERPAFTLIEVVVVVVVIAAAVAIAFPVMSMAGKLRGRIVTLNRLKESARTIGVYANDFRGYVPLPLDPARDAWTLRIASGWEIDVPRYFMSFLYWHLVMTDLYFDQTAAPVTVYAAKKSGRGRLSSAPFALPCVYFAHPDFWDQSTRTGRSQYGGTRLDQVLYPSSKFLLVSRAHTTKPADPNHPPQFMADDPLPGLVPFARGDLGAGIVERSRVFPGVKSGEGVMPGAFHHADFHYGLHTVGGVRGRDLR